MTSLRGALYMCALNLTGLSSRVGAASSLSSWPGTWVFSCGGSESVVPAICLMVVGAASTSHRVLVSSVDVAGPTANGFPNSGTVGEVGL
jgi:hypothetical protein